MSTRVSIRTNSELERWLRSNTGFEDAYAYGLSVDRMAAGGPALQVTLGVEIAGTFRAGEKRVIRDHVLTATGLEGPVPEIAGVLSPGYCCEGIEVLPAAVGVAFGIDLPGRLRVACCALEIEVRDDRHELIPPWLSDREFGATVPGESLPSPEQWVERFRAGGVSVVWRYLGSEVQPPSDSKDYEGWYLQEPRRLATSSGGLFFFACRIRDQALVVQWLRWDASDELWRAAQKVIGRFDRAEVWCGNCHFSASEWLGFVEGGRLPPRLRGGPGTE